MTIIFLCIHNCTLFDTWVQREQLSSNATMRKNGDAYDPFEYRSREWLETNQLSRFTAAEFYYGILWGFVSLFWRVRSGFLTYMTRKSGFSSLNVRNIYLALEKIQLWFAIL